METKKNTIKNPKCKYCLGYVFEKNEDGSFKKEHIKCKSNFKNTIKGVKAYGAYIKGKLFDVSMNKPLPIKDIEIIPVLITPITKITKK